MAIYPVETAEVERQLAEEYLEKQWFAEQEKEKREHAYRMGRLEFATQTRHKAIRDCVVILCKMPVLFMLALTLPLVIMTKREVPKFLQDFMSL